MKCVARKCLETMVVASILLVQMGCGGADPYGPPVVDSDDLDSPQAIHAAANAALQAGDYRTFAGHGTPDSLERMAVYLVRTAIQLRSASDNVANILDGTDAESTRKRENLTKLLAAMEQVFSKHGLPPIPTTPGESDQIAGAIEDKAEFFADVTNILVDLRDEQGPDLTPDVTLTSVEVSGDSAVGTTTRMKDGKEISEQLEFRKIDGVWKFDI